MATSQKTIATAADPSDVVDQAIDCMTLAKADLQQKIEQLQQIREEKQKTQESHALPGSRSKKRNVDSTPLSLDEKIESIKAAAKKADGGSDKDKKLVALRVMSMLKEYDQPKLWKYVSHHFVEEGLLDLSEALTRMHFDDVMFLLQSDEVSDVTTLNLSGNAVFVHKEAGRFLGAVLATMSKLKVLSMSRCSLMDESWEAITKGIIPGRQLEEFDCRWNKLTDNSVETMERILNDLPNLVVWGAGCGFTKEDEKKLNNKFREVIGKDVVYRYDLWRGNSPRW